MSDSNRTQLYYVAEATWGTTPTPSMETLRFTSESLNYNIGTTKSAEIRSDRQIPDLIQTSAEAGGDINVELSYGSFDQFLKAALFSADGGATITQWAGVLSSTTEIITSGASAGNLEFTIAAGAGGTITLGSSVTHAIVVGQWIKLMGSATDDGYHLVTTVAGKVLTCGVAGSEVLDETDLATIKGGMIRNGTTEKSFTIESKHDDITELFSYTGMVPNTFSLSVQADAVVTGTFGFIGKDETLAQATVGGGVDAATTTDVMNAVSNVAQIMVGASLSAWSASIFIQSLDFTLTNNVRGIRGVGSLAAKDLGVGVCDVTGTINTFFADDTLYDVFAANTGTGLSFKIEDGAGDGAGNAYIITFHSVKFTSDGIDASGQDQDVMENLGWQALRDATYDCTIQIDRFTAGQTA